MKYFVNVSTLDELRKEYRRLAKVNHPDMGGSAEEMKVINIEYEMCFKIRIKYGSDVVKEANTVFCVTA